MSARPSPLDASRASWTRASRFPRLTPTDSFGSSASTSTNESVPFVATGVLPPVGADLFPYQVCWVAHEHLAMLTGDSPLALFNLIPLK